VTHPRGGVEQSGRPVLPPQRGLRRPANVSWQMLQMLANVGKCWQCQQEVGEQQSVAPHRPPALQSLQDPISLMPWVCRGQTLTCIAWRRHRLVVASSTARCSYSLMLATMSSGQQPSAACAARQCQQMLANVGKCWEMKGK
jgi:hypothetical protein